MPHQPLLDLLAAVRMRAAHHSTDSWLHADLDGHAAVAIAALEADPAIAARWPNDTNLDIPSIAHFTFAPACAVRELARAAAGNGADPADDARLVEQFLANARLDDDRVDVEVRATFLGPTLADAERLTTSAGTIARARPGDLDSSAATVDAAASPPYATTYTFIVSVPATTTTSVAPAPLGRTAPRADALITQQLLRFQLALALVGDGPVQEHLVMVRPRFSSAAAGVPLATAGPLATAAS